VQATLANAREAIRDGDARAEQQLQPELVRLAASEDAAEGMRAFVARDEPTFRGR
jgi:enoyl-CoA hydratase/carnithine racemase